MHILCILYIHKRDQNDSPLLENRSRDYWSEVKRIKTTQLGRVTLLTACPLRRRFPIILHQNIKNYIPV